MNPVVSQPIEDLAVIENAENTAVNLFEHFDDPLTTGRVATFELADSSIGGGTTNVLLFDQAGAGAPATVGNFVNYVEDNDYANSVIHRSIPGFIVQGGGFTINSDLEVGTVPADEPVVNEFSADRSNLRGTIAMAKLGNDPDSATNQWFFNLGDNAANLDSQNGGFTVFGEVLGDADLAVVDAIASLPIINATGANPAFTDIPVIAEDPSNPVVETEDDLVRYSNISVNQQEELTFEVVSNSNPELVDIAVAGGELTLDYQDGQSGTADINIRATDLLGDVIEDTFTVNVEPDAGAENPESVGSDGDDTIEGSEGDDTIRSGNGNDSIFGVAGNDLLNGGAGNDFIDGGIGEDLVLGGTGDDILFGGADNDILHSEVGKDTAAGDAGNDLINGGFGSDNLSGGEGNDTLKGGAENDSLGGDAGDDLLQGGDWDDLFSGGEGNDFIEGDRGFDNLDGGAGNDTLIGGTGVDLFNGGAGNDLFVLESERNANWILDFEAGDKIGLADDIAVGDLAIGGTISTFIGYQGTNLAILPNVSPDLVTAEVFEEFVF